MVDVEIRSRIESFTSELTDLIRSLALSRAEQVLNGPAHRRAGVDVLAPPGTRGVVRPQARRRPTGPVSLERYERMAIERALAECSGDAAAAAKLLRIGKSTMYRKMMSLPQLTSPLFTTKEPVSLEAYERIALEHALEQAGGDRMVAAEVLGVGKSTLYRKLAQHGLA